MKSVEVKITPGGDADRLEVLIRIIFGIILGIIASVLGFIAGIIVFVNFFTCLILAKRVAIDFVADYIKWITQVYAYLYYVTDERPPWTP